MGQLLTFSEALREIKKGNCVARKAWKGRGMFLFLSASHESRLNLNPFRAIEPGYVTVKYGPRIYIRTASNKIIFWDAGQSEIMADDWVVLC